GYRAHCTAAGAACGGMLASLLVIFFYLSGSHRYLHSFPTRRSSDLLQATSTTQTSESSPMRAIRASGRSAPSFSGSPQDGEKLRSEEHTSELQSRSDLVCRLLLEKKNQSTTERSRHPPPSPTAAAAQ